MKKKSVGLTQRERLFCCTFVSCGNYKEALAAAGYRCPERSLSQLLSRDDINEEIDRLLAIRSRTSAMLARAGYERLAFGNISDAVKLVFKDSVDSQELEGYDLFNVSEIRRPKDGAMEIKFFDRTKALEKLESIGSENKNTIPDFYSALLRGAGDEDDRPGVGGGDE